MFTPFTLKWALWSTPRPRLGTCLQLSLYLELPLQKDSVECHLLNWPKLLERLRIEKGGRCEFRVKSFLFHGER